MPYRTVTSGLIVDKTIVTADLADDAVTGAKIAACAIADEHIARGTITGAALTTSVVHEGGLCIKELKACCLVARCCAAGLFIRGRVVRGQHGLIAPNNQCICCEGAVMTQCGCLFFYSGGYWRKVIPE